MTPPGHIRPWRLSCAVAALRAAFPGAKVHIRHYDPQAGCADFVVSQPITITDSRELLTMTTSWSPRRLRVAAEVLNACEHEAAIAALVTAAVSKMERGAVVEIGDLGRASSRNVIRQVAEANRDGGRQSEPDREAPAQPAPVSVRVVAEQAPTRGPRLGRRVPGEELRTLLRRAVVR